MCLNSEVFTAFTWFPDPSKTEEARHQMKVLNATELMSMSISNSVYLLIPGSN